MQKIYCGISKPYRLQHLTELLAMLEQQAICRVIRIESIMRLSPDFFVQIVLRFSLARDNNVISRYA